MKMKSSDLCSKKQTEGSRKVEMKEERTGRPIMGHHVKGHDNDGGKKGHSVVRTIQGKQKNPW